MLYTSHLHYVICQSHLVKAEKIKKEREREKEIDTHMYVYVTGVFGGKG